MVNITLQPGKYVVAVSGGVDSVVLLHILQQLSEVELIVAHFNHGIREDAPQDMHLVKSLAAKYRIPFVAKCASLGVHASEALARQHRYEFLHDVREQSEAAAIVTAHHQDDVIETALLNLLRGTKRRGLISLKSTDLIKRPLLDLTKEELISYARSHNLEWHEDSTNTDIKYRRNELRSIIKDSLNSTNRQELISLLQEIDHYDKEIEKIVTDYVEEDLNRKTLNQLGLAEAYEITAGWLRKHNISFDKDAIKRLVIGSRILQPKSQIDIQQGYYAELTRDKIILKRR